MKKETKKTLLIILLFFIALMSIATFAGCLNYAYVSKEGFYAFATIVTLITYVICLVKVCKDKFKKLGE